MIVKMRNSFWKVRVNDFEMKIISKYFSSSRKPNAVMLIPLLPRDVYDKKEVKRMDRHEIFTEMIEDRKEVYWFAQICKSLIDMLWHDTIDVSLVWKKKQEYCKLGKKVDGYHKRRFNQLKMMDVETFSSVKVAIRKLKNKGWKRHEITCMSFEEVLYYSKLDRISEEGKLG